MTNIELWELLAAPWNWVGIGEEVDPAAVVNLRLTLGRPVDATTFMTVAGVETVGYGTSVTGMTVAVDLINFTVLYCVVVVLIVVVWVDPSLVVAETGQYVT